METCDQTNRTRSAERAPPPLHKATDLTAGGDMAQIELDGQVYTLRITRQGKLILTK